MFQQLGLAQDHLKLHFTSYKHSQGQQFSLTVTQGVEAHTCPVQALRHYLKVRGTTQGLLFQYPSGMPVLRADFNNVLRRALVFNNISPSTFKGHSFRIGAATTAAALGLSDSQIRQLGRWKSDAFKKYIRSASRTSSL